MMLKRMSALLIVVLLLSFGCSAQAGWVTLVVSDQNTDETPEWSGSLFPDPTATDESDDLSDFMSLFSADLTTSEQDDQSKSPYLSTLDPDYDPDPVANLDVQSSGDFQYVVLGNGTAQITGYTGSDTQLVLPQTLDGYMVTSIGDGAFMSCYSLSNIQFPASLTSIGKDAFLYTDYEHVTAPAGMANTQQNSSAERCGYCNGGWIDCSTCGTFGYCPSCEGLGGPMIYTANGWEFDDCDACGDSGACPTCGYSGFLECKFCNGTGFAY